MTLLSEWLPLIEWPLERLLKNIMAGHSVRENTVLIRVMFVQYTRNTIIIFIVKQYNSNSEGREIGYV